MVLQKNLSFFCPTSTDIILALFTLFTLVVGDSGPTTLVKSICGKTRSEHPAIYDANFVDAMSVVSQQIAADRFGSAESGNGSDRIYSLGQCFGHVSLVQCRLCYDETRVKLPLCMPNISSRIYLDGCFLRNDNRNFSDEVMDSVDTHVCDYRANSSNSIRFGEIASGLVRNLSLEAPQVKGYFKIGSSRGPKFTVFAFVQCWRSVNKSACRACLENASERALGCLPANDGRGLNAGCYVRYSNTKFYEENSSSRDSSLVVPRRLGAALGSIFAGVVIMVGVILYKRRRMGTSARFDDLDGSSEIIKSISESHLGFKYEVLRKATKDFHEGNKLGQGGFGSVYKGVLPDGREVAIKRLFFNTRQWVDQFFNEVNLISKVQHKNLVKLIGCSVEGPESLLVYEYLSNTSLDKFLFDSIKKQVLDWGRRMDIIVGTAEGLGYLHEASEVRIIHRDIKASNILLDEKFKPKIADFGLARYFAEDLSHISTGIAGTLGYMSPEYVVHGQLTEKADIYSYGVLVLEMITGKKNTSSISTSKEGHSLLSLVWEHYNSKSLIEIMDPCLRGHCPEEQVLKVFQVGLLCTQASPTLRPPTWKVVEMLTSMGKGIPSPTQPPFINIKGAEVGSDGSKSSNILSSSSKSQASVNEMSLSIPQGR